MPGATWVRPELMQRAVPLSTESSVPTGWSLEEKQGTSFSGGADRVAQAQAQTRADAAASRILKR